MTDPEVRSVPEVRTAQAGQFWQALKLATTLLLTATDELAITDAGVWPELLPASLLGEHAPWLR